MKNVAQQLRQLKKAIYIQLILIDLIANNNPAYRKGIDLENIHTSLRLGRSWIGRAVGYMAARRYAALREEVADRAELKEHPEQDIAEALKDIQQEIAQLVDDLSGIYENPTMADISDQTLMCMEMAWQHLNEAQFHATYLIEWEMSLQDNGQAQHG